MIFLNRVKNNWENNAVQFFNQFASQKYKKKKNSQENTDKDYTLEDIRNIEDFPKLLQSYNKGTEDGLQLLKVILFNLVETFMLQSTKITKIYNLYVNFDYTMNKLKKKT